MALVVVANAALRCSLGASPGVLSTVVPHKLKSGTFAANLDDATLMPGSFGTCAAPGRLTPAGTPGPCTPTPALPRWAPAGKPVLMIGGAPALTDGCRLSCSFGGMIEVSNPAQTRLQAP